MLTREILARLCPRPKNKAKADIWDGYVEALLSNEGKRLFHEFKIDSKLRMAHLLAQWAHESGGFTLIWESGAYSADRIMQIFGVGKHSAGVTWQEAKRLAGDGPALFDRVYGLGNPKKARELGNKEPGDGWRFSGLGIVQITGRAAHERYAAKIGCTLADLAKPINSIHAALLEWAEKGCNGSADRDDLVVVTKKINGGQNGLEARRAYLARAKRLLETVDVNDEPLPEPVALPPAPATVTIKDLAPISTKVRTIRNTGSILHVIWMSIVGLFSLENVGYANGAIADVKTLVEGLALPGLAVMAICGVLLGRYLVGRIVADYQDGRYTPSGS